MSEGVFLPFDACPYPPSLTPPRKSRNLPPLRRWVKGDLAVVCFLAMVLTCFLLDASFYSILGKIQSSIIIFTPHLLAFTYLKAYSEKKG